MFSYDTNLYIKISRLSFSTAEKFTYEIMLVPQKKTAEFLCEDFPYQHLYTNLVCQSVGHSLQLIKIILLKVASFFLSVAKDPSKR